MTSQAWNSEAFMAWFYKEYSHFIYQQSWRYCSKACEVEDLVQEVWLKLCSKGELLCTYTKTQQISYIATAVRNTAISLVRQTVIEYSLEFADKIAYEETDMLSDIFDRQMKAKEFRRLWPLVPASTRELLERKYILTESNAEISRSMGIGENSVRMYLTRARRTAFAILVEYKAILVS